MVDHMRQMSLPFPLSLYSHHLKTTQNVYREAVIMLAYYKLGNVGTSPTTYHKISIVIL